MTPNWKAILAGAATGTISAVIVDLMAWSKTPDGTAYGWKTAFKRWVAGAVTGAATAAGINAAGATTNA